MIHEVTKLKSNFYITDLISHISQEVISDLH